jgi:1-acyl-sn-glycerol-3-phosphate acyltransferase
MTAPLSELRPQVYADPRPAEYFEPYYRWALTHRPDWVYDLARLLFLPFCELVFRARCIDADNVPASGGAILAPNHFSALDHFFVAIYLRRRIRFMAKSQLFRAPLAGVIPHAGAFPVRRGQQDERAIQTAVELLRRGGVIVIYPEGGRSRTGQVAARARAGVGRLALETGVPVVPVAIHGSSRARNWKRLQFPRVTVQYGEPVTVTHDAGASRENQQAFADQVLGNVRVIYEDLDQGGRGSAVRRARARRRVRTPNGDQPKKTSAVS